MIIMILIVLAFVAFLVFLIVKNQKNRKTLFKKLPGDYPDPADVKSEFVSREMVSEIIYYSEFVSVLIPKDFRIEKQRELLLSHIAKGMEPGE